MDTYNWALPVVTFLPLAGALVMMLLPKEEEQLHKAIALLTSLATLAVGVFVFLQFDYGNGHFQFLVDRSWIDVINSRFIMGIDGLSLPLFGLTLAVVPLVIIYSWNHIPDPGNPKAFLALMLIDGSALRQRGRTFLTFVAFVGGSALVWIGYDYSQQYSTWFSLTVGGLLGIATP